MDPAVSAGRFWYISKTSRIMLRYVLNKPFWHISDFVLASYTFGVWKCLDLWQIVVICGKCWFSFFIRRKHEKVILQHDNARPRVAKPVKTYLETLGWEILPEPPYSPHIAPSDYYLFRSIAHGLADQHFRSYEDIEKWLDSWIAWEIEHFYHNGIWDLSERWAKVVANDG